MSTITPINYVVTYNSAYTLSPTGAATGTPTLLAPLKSIQFGRNIAPQDDSATIVLAGVQNINAAREVYFYRINSNGTYTLKFRGMTTNPTYHVGADGLTTTIQVNSLWYILQTRLFQIAGKSPPPLQPNTNPYLVYLNPLLNLNFGTIWALILENAFQESYSTGHLPPVHLANLTTGGSINPNIQYVTDFDKVVVNDNMNVQYQAISAVVDRLVTSALFNSDNSTPFLAEYRLDIGDWPYGSPPRQSIVDTYTPNLPTATVMLFDPVHSKLGNGQNRTGILLGDNSLDPAGTLPISLQYPMAYVEFGVTNGYQPVDTIIFSEGDNIVSIDVTYDYLSMNNGWVLTGGSFLGSDVVAIPIENQRSIAEYGLKQTNAPLQNVVDQGEINRYVGTSINFFQHPIPNIVLKPDYTYASSHVMYAGDYILINAPSLAGVMQDSNGNLLEGSYDNLNPGHPLLTAAFTARIKTIDISWDADNGEDITLTLTFPVTNVPIADWETAVVQQGSNAGAIQYMYTTVQPATKTVIGRANQNTGASTYQTGSDFITNRGSTYSIEVKDNTTYSPFLPDIEILSLPILVQTMPNDIKAIDSAGIQVSGDDVLIYQFLVQVDAATTSASSVWLTILQPDGIAVYDNALALGQQVNILSLLSKSHTAQPSPETGNPVPSTPLLNTLSGNYNLIFRNATAFAWCPNPLFASLPAAVFSTTPVSSGTYVYYIYCPVNSNGYEFAMSYVATLQYSLVGGATFSWPVVTDPTTGLPVTRYNIYRTGSVSYGTFDILQFGYLDNTATNSYYDPITGTTTASTQPFDNSYQTADAIGLNIVYGSNYADPTVLIPQHQYWYVITAINPAGVETQCSQTGTVFSGNNTSPQPISSEVPEPNTTGVATSSTATLLTDTTQTWTAGQWVGYALIYTTGPAAGTGETILSNTSDTITTNAFSPAPDASGDTYYVISDVLIDWPAVPYAQSYNVYRADGGISTTMPTTRTDYLLLGNVTETEFDDTGISGGTPLSTGIATQLTPSDTIYNVYLNYSFLPNPANTKTLSTAQTNNPATQVVYNTTLQWVYQTYPYVAP